MNKKKRDVAGNGSESRSDFMDITGAGYGGPCLNT